MTLAKNLMKNLSDWVPKERNTLKTSDADSGWHVHITADQCGSLASEIWELKLSRSESPSQMDLTQWADQLAGKTLGLLEPLRVLEVDNHLQQAIVRSESPAENDEQLSYYEIVLKGTNEATLRRYPSSRNGHSRREQILFVLTHEAIANLVASLTD